jgi:drug/metabolite transporter (DMT)-like permease
MGELAALSTALTWAIASIVYARVSVPGRGPNELNLFKTLIGALAFGLTSLALEGALWPAGLTRSDVQWLVVSSVLGIAVADSAYLSALARLGVRRGALFISLVPPTTACLAYVLLDEPLTGAMLAGMGLALVGTTLVVRERAAPGKEVVAADMARPIDVVGVLGGAIYVLCQALANVAIKRIALGASALSVCTMRFAIGALVLAVFIVVTGRLRGTVALFRARDVLVPAGTATIIGTYVGVWLSMFALRSTTAGIATTLASTTPVYVLLIGRIFFGEPLTLQSTCGVLLAVSGVAVLMLL